MALEVRSKTSFESKVQILIRIAFTFQISGKGLILVCAIVTDVSRIMADGASPHLLMHIGHVDTTTAPRIIALGQSFPQEKGWAYAAAYDSTMWGT